MLVAAENPIMLSALQHYSYCPRQCALIHQEQCFDENVHTIKGQRVHQRVDTPESRSEEGKRIERAMPLYNKKYGLIGKADIVEFLDDGTPYPVEYKHGKRHAKRHDDLQLAAQAICLEEMIGKTVNEGAIYHHKSHRRRIVIIDDQLRRELVDTIKAVHRMLNNVQIPPPIQDRKRCKECSLFDLCQPDIVAARDRYTTIRQSLFDIEDDTCNNF